MERIYCDLMLLASGVIAALAVAIMGVKIHNAFHIEFHLLLHRI